MKSLDIAASGNSGEGQREEVEATCLGKSLEVTEHLSFQSFRASS